MREQVKNVISEELTKSINAIERNFDSNFTRKSNNFLFDEQMTSEMVFNRSFEFEISSVFEKCARRFAVLRYGKENVPNIVNPRNLSHNINPQKVNGQIFVTDIDINSDIFKNKIVKFQSENSVSRTDRFHENNNITQESIKTLLPITAAQKDKKIHTKSVDLVFYDGTDWNILAMSTSGDLNSYRASYVMNDMLVNYAGLNVLNSKLYYATFYNKNGEGKSWNGIIKNHMAYPDMFLIGKDFWNKILPLGVSFEEFKSIYRDVFNEMNFDFKNINNKKNEFLYDVVLSFAGEDRNYVEQCANILSALGIKVFYDMDEESNLWGKNLYSHFADIYLKKARYAVVFISKYYQQKKWTSHELKYINQRVFEEKMEYLLPVKLDDTDLPDLPTTIGFIKNKTPYDVAVLIARKIDAKIDVDLMLIELKNNLPDEYIIQIRNDKVHFNYVAEDFETEYPLKLLMEIYKLNLIYEMFIASGILLI